MNINHRKSFFPIFHSLAVLLALSFLLASCSSDFTKKFEAVPDAFGSPNQLSIVADQDIWDGPVGDTLRWYFSSAYPILPQPEPIFDLRHFTAEELSTKSVHQNRRAFLFVGNINDEQSPTAQMIRHDIGTANVEKAERDTSYHTSVGRDKWANGQLLVYLFGTNKAMLPEIIHKNFPAIARRVNKADLSMVDATVYQDGQDRKLIEELQKTFGIYLKIPGDYFLAINDGQTMWVRKENEFLSSNILIHKVPYKDKSQLTREGIKLIQDTLGRKYVSTEIEGTFMRTNDVDLPMLTQTVDLNGNYALEARGIWEIFNDYMGGPFISYLILSPDNKELIFIEGFVNAPGKEKKKYMQQLEYVLSSYQFGQPK